MTRQATFDADLARINTALEPWVLTFDDGWQGISPDAPADLLRVHRGLTCYGYANGLL